MHKAVLPCSWVVLVLALPGFASDSGQSPRSDTAPIPVLEQAVANTRDWLADPEREALVYQQIAETHDGEEVERRILRIDQRKPRSRQAELISVNGEPPTSEELENFRKSLKNPAKDDNAGGQIEVSLNDFDTDGARLAGRQGKLLIFDVPNALDSMLVTKQHASMAEHLLMRVYVDVSHAGGPYLKTLAVSAEAPFKPALIGKVKQLDIQITFYLLEQGLLVTQLVDTDINARALFKKINNHRQVIYTGYEIHPPRSTPPGSATEVIFPAE